MSVLHKAILIIYWFCLSGIYKLLHYQLIIQRWKSLILFVMFLDLLKNVVQCCWSRVWIEKGIHTKSEWISLSLNTTALVHFLLLVDLSANLPIFQSLVLRIWVYCVEVLLFYSRSECVFPVRSFLYTATFFIFIWSLILSALKKWFKGIHVQDTY